MPVDASELEGLRDALIRARATGIRSTLYDGKRIKYATDAEMAAAIADLEARIRRASPGRRNVVAFSSRKGL